MTTQPKLEANAANAQHSTGPRTATGKATSSRNALKHGLTAKTVLLPGEDPAEYENFCSRMLHDFDPLNTIEEAHALELIDIQWRLQRVSMLETRILSADQPDMKALNNISLHASRMKRQYSATLKEFQQMHAANLNDREQQFVNAATIHLADQYLQRKSTLGELGFVFTMEEITTWMTNKQALRDATRTLMGMEAGEATLRAAA